MTYAAPLVHANPSPPSVEVNAVAECIQACFDRAQACTPDADAADLGEPQVQAMVRCIRLCLDCADVCLATGRILSRQTAFDLSTARATLQTWLQVCMVCGDECQQHAQRGFAHCQTYMQACRRCEETCNTLLALLPGSTRSSFNGDDPPSRGRASASDTMPSPGHALTPCRIAAPLGVPDLTSITCFRCAQPKSDQPG